MKSVRRGLGAAALTALFLLVASCAPQRQSAWEREAERKLTEKPEPTEPVAEEAPDPRVLAEEAWAQRADRGQLEKAISLWEPLVAEVDDLDILVRLARAHFILADIHIQEEGDIFTMVETYERGIIAGERAMMAASPAFADKVRNGVKVDEAVAEIGIEGQSALYWYALNLGRYAVAKGITATLHYKDIIYAIMGRVLELDETFFHAAPHRFFGAFYAKAPAIAGGDLERSKKHFDKALALDSDYLENKVVYAEYYAPKAQNRELFTRLLNEVQDADPTVLPDLIMEQQHEQVRAKRLLEQADELF